MSGRIRSIKPELLEDAVTAGLSDLAFRLFIACILLADDYGNLRFEPELLRGQIYWKRAVDPGLLTDAMTELERLITPYIVKEQRYGAIKNWEKHQRISHKGKPRVPGLAESLPRVSGNSPESLVPDLRSPISDHRPPSAPESPPEETKTPDPEPSERRFTHGTSGYDARAVFTEAVQQATNKPFALTSATFHTRDLCDLLNAHAPPGSQAFALSWLAQTVADWVRSVDAKFTNGYAPSKLLAWLNENRPSGILATGTEGPSPRARRSLQGWKP